MIRRDGSAAAASSSPGSVYAPLIEAGCTAGSFPVLYPLAVSLCAVQRSPGLRQEAEDTAEVSLIPVRPGLFPCTLIPTPARVSCRSGIPVSRLRFFPTSFTIAQTVHAGRFEPAVLLERGKNPTVFRSGFLAVLARSGSARITLFKSNLIQAEQSHSPGMRCLWKGLPVPARRTGV